MPSTSIMPMWVVALMFTWGLASTAEYSRADSNTSCANFTQRGACTNAGYCTWVESEAQDDEDTECVPLDCDRRNSGDCVPPPAFTDLLRCIVVNGVCVSRDATEGTSMTAATSTTGGTAATSSTGASSRATSGSSMTVTSVTAATAASTSTSTPEGTFTSAATSTTGGTAATSFTGASSRATSVSSMTATSVTAATAASTSTSTPEVTFTSATTSATGGTAATSLTAASNGTTNVSSTTTPEDPSTSVATSTTSLTAATSFTPASNRTTNVSCGTATSVTATTATAATSTTTPRPQNCNSTVLLELQAPTLTNASHISPSDVTPVDPTQWLRVGIQAFASSPCAATPLNVNIQWALLTLGLGTAVASGSGLVVNVAPAVMTAGETYVLRVIGTSRGNGHAVSYAAFAAVAPQVPVVILGGSHSVRAGSKFTVSLDTQALQLAGLAWRSAPAVWSCAGDLPCPTQLSQAIADAAGRWWLTVDAGIPAGTSAVLQATIKGSPSASVTITVVSSRLPLLRFLTAPTSASLLSGRASFMVAVENAPVQSVAWTIDGEHVGYGSTSATMTNLQPGACTVLVTATNDAGSGSAKLTFNVPARVTGECVVSAVDPAAAIVGLVTPIVVAANFTGEGASLRYRFGYVNADSTRGGGGVLYFTPDESIKPSLQVVAPAVYATAPVSFVVEAVDYQSEQVVSTTMCTALISFAADALTATVNSYAALLASAANAGDVDTVTRVANAMAVASGTTVLTTGERAEAARAAVSAVSTLLNLTTTQATPLTRLSRDTLLTVLNLTLFTSAAVVTGSAETAAAALAVAVAAVTPAAGASVGSRTALDAPSSAGGALEVLSALHEVAPRTAASAAIAVTAAVAGQAQPGATPTKIWAPEYAVTGVAAPANEPIDVPVVAGGASIKLPPTYAPDDAGQVLSLGAIAFASTPFTAGTDDGNSNATRISHVVDFAVQLDGVAQVVSNVPGIALTFNATGAAADAIFNGTVVPQCMYFDTAAGQWSTSGITLVGVVALGGAAVVTCNTTHLSYYALFASAPAAATTPTPSSPSQAEAESGGGVRSGAVAAICATIALAVALAAAAVIKRRSIRARRAPGPDSQDADGHETLLIMPDTASSCESPAVDGSQISV